MDQLVLLMLVLLGALVTVPVGERLGLPPPVLMTLLGIVLAVLPFVPNVDVPPGIVLPLLLPPLLYAAVQRTSWRQFAASWQPIFLLAVALVFVTTAAVAAVAHALVPGLPLAAAVAMGALVAPPDPVAATAVAGRLGLPRRLVSLLEGEGLFNDVTAIVLYLLVPFAAYALADRLHGSGVLAVLTASFYLAERMADADDVVGRLTATTFWQVVDTLVTGVAFGLIGLELHVVLGTVHGRLGLVLGWSAAVVAVVVLVRLVWLLPAAWVARKMRPPEPEGTTEVPLSWRETAVMWWAGMRGVASVALALAIPLETEGGGPFPERAVIVFISFAVILVTLIVQGLTLPWLVTRLGVKGDTAAERELEKRLAVEAAGAAKRRLRQIDEAEALPEEVVELLTRRMMDLGLRISPEIADDERREAYEQRARRIKLVRRVQGEMLSAARQVVLEARRDPGADPAVVSRVLRRLDARSWR